MSLPSHATILDHATAAYAWSDSKRFAWGNRSFLALASQLKTPPEELFERLKRHPEDIETGDQTWRPRWCDASPGLLVELLPTSESPDRHLTDSLTGLLSREAIEAEIANHFAKRKENPFTLVFVDLDDFKRVNDTAGHLVGDRCLEVVGERLRGLVRTADVVGRYGGDEFVLLLDRVSDEATLRRVFDRFRAGFAEPIAGADWTAQVGLSLGAAFSGDDYPTAEAMLAAADRAMYADKRATAAPADIADSPRFG